MNIFSALIEKLALSLNFVYHKITNNYIFFPVRSEARLLLEKKKLDREIKYREDCDALENSFIGRGVTESGARPHRDALKRQKDRDIELIEFEIQKLDIEESLKLKK